MHKTEIQLLYVPTRIHTGLVKMIQIVSSPVSDQEVANLPQNMKGMFLKTYILQVTVNLRFAITPPFL